MAQSHALCVPSGLTVNTHRVRMIHLRGKPSRWQASLASLSSLTFGFASKFVPPLSCLFRRPQPKACLITRRYSCTFKEIPASNSVTVVDETILLQNTSGLLVTLSSGKGVRCAFFQCIRGTIRCQTFGSTFRILCSWFSVSDSFAAASKRVPHRRPRRTACPPWFVLARQYCILQRWARQRRVELIDLLELVTGPRVGRSSWRHLEALQVVALSGRLEAASANVLLNVPGGVSHVFCYNSSSKARLTL